MAAEAGFFRVLVVLRVLVRVLGAAGAAGLAAVGVSTTAGSVGCTAVTGSATGATVRAGVGAFLTTFLAVVFFLEERAFLCTIMDLPFLYVSPRMGGRKWWIAHTCKCSGGRYWRASARWWGWMCSDWSRSATVRATRRMRS